MVEKSNAAHSFSSTGRDGMVISGVTDVVSFDDCCVVLKTVMGIMSVDGAEMRIINLNVDSKDIEISGKINGIIYQGGQSQKSPLFKKR